MEAPIRDAPSYKNSNRLSHQSNSTADPSASDYANVGKLITSAENISKLSDGKEKLHEYKQLIAKHDKFPIEHRAIPGKLSQLLGLITKGVKEFAKSLLQQEEYVLFEELYYALVKTHNRLAISLLLFLINCKPNEINDVTHINKYFHVLQSNFPHYRAAFEVHLNYLQNVVVGKSHTDCLGIAEIKSYTSQLKSARKLFGTAPTTAIAILKDLKQQRPNRSQAQFKLAEIYENIGEFEQAYCEFDALLEKFPHAWIARFTYGVLLGNRQKFHRAIIVLTPIIESEDLACQPLRLAKAYDHLANYNAKLHNLDLSFKYFEIIRERYPWHWPGLHRYGLRIAEYEADYERSKAILLSALEACTHDNPYIPFDKHKMSSLYHALSIVSYDIDPVDKDGDVRRYNKLALELNPNNDSAHSMRGHLLTEKSKKFAWRGNTRHRFVLNEGHRAAHLANPNRIEQKHGQKPTVKHLVLETRAPEFTEEFDVQHVAAQLQLQDEQAESTSALDSNPFSADSASKARSGKQKKVTKKGTPLEPIFVIKEPESWRDAKKRLADKARHEEINATAPLGEHPNSIFAHKPKRTCQDIVYEGCANFISKCYEVISSCGKK